MKKIWQKVKLIFSIIGMAAAAVGLFLVGGKIAKLFAGRGSSNDSDAVRRARAAIRDDSRVKQDIDGIRSGSEGIEDGLSKSSNGLESSRSGADSIETGIGRLESANKRLRDWIQRLSESDRSGSD